MTNWIMIIYNNKQNRRSLTILWLLFWLTAPMQSQWPTTSSTSNYTSTRAWSPILRAQLAVHEFDIFYWKRTMGEVTGFKVRMGRVTEWDVCACRSMSSLWTELELFSLRWQSHDNRSDGAGTARGGEASEVTLCEPDSSLDFWK